MLRWKRSIWIVFILCVVLIGTGVIWRLEHLSPSLTTVQGAVICRDKDARRQFPIAGVLVTVWRGESRNSTETDASGYFKVTFPEVVWPGQEVNLSFRRSDYKPFDMIAQVSLSRKGRKLYVVSMDPISSQPLDDGKARPSVVSNVRVRYSVNSQIEQNMGNATETFQVVNHGNVSCNARVLCSPDGNWTASKDSIAMDAGVGNEYRNVRASCIAGPCPFTRIDSSGFEKGGRLIHATAEAWSDTATFLLEAEVFHTTIASIVRESYPVVFDRALNFTLPSAQEGASIEADIDGTPMVFPLGPDLNLSWTVCTVRANTEADKSTVYRCELKPGYRF